MLLSEVQGKFLVDLMFRQWNEMKTGLSDDNIYVYKHNYTVVSFPNFRTSQWIVEADKQVKTEP